LALGLRATAPALALASESAVAMTQTALALGSAAGRRRRRPGVAKEASTTEGGILSAGWSMGGRVIDGEPATRARDGGS